MTLCVTQRGRYTFYKFPNFTHSREEGYKKKNTFLSHNITHVTDIPKRNG